MPKFIVLLVFVLLANISQAQLYLGNFTGGDSEQVNGRWNYEVPFGFPIPIKKWKGGDHKIVIFPSYTFSQTYFNDKFIVSSDGNTSTIFLDPDEGHEYRTSIFSHQSKIRMWAWEAWLGFETKVGKAQLNLFYSPSYIQVGSFRRRYVEANEVIKVRDRFRDKADYYNIQRLQHRLKGSVSLYGVGVGGFLNLTSFFKESTGIDLQKFGLTLILRDSFWTNLFNFNMDDDPAEKRNPDIKRMMF